MARIRISVAGEELGVWDLDEMTLQDSFLLKAATGLDPAPIEAGLGDMSPESWRAVVWWLRHEKEPKLRPEDVTFRWKDIDIERLTADPSTGAESDGAETSVPDETSGSTSSPAGSDSGPVTSTA